MSGYVWRVWLTAWILAVWARLAVEWSWTVKREAPRELLAGVKRWAVWDTSRTVQRVEIAPAAVWVDVKTAKDERELWWVSSVSVRRCQQRVWMYRGRWVWVKTARGLWLVDDAGRMRVVDPAPPFRMVLVGTLAPWTTRRQPDVVACESEIRVRDETGLGVCRWSPDTGLWTWHRWAGTAVPRGHWSANRDVWVVGQPDEGHGDGCVDVWCSARAEDDDDDDEWSLWRRWRPRTPATGWGWAVCALPQCVCVAAPWEPSIAYGCGAVHVYRWPYVAPVQILRCPRPLTWSEQCELRFGCLLAASDDGSWLAVGSQYQRRGRVFVYRYHVRWGAFRWVSEREVPHAGLRHIAIDTSGHVVLASDRAVWGVRRVGLHADVWH